MVVVITTITIAIVTIIIAIIIEKAQCLSASQSPMAAEFDACAREVKIAAWRHHLRISASAHPMTAEIDASQSEVKIGTWRHPLHISPLPPL